MSKRLFIIVIMLLLWCLHLSCYAGLRDYPSVAVLKFDNQSPISNDFTQADAGVVTALMIDELVNCERFNVVERQQLKAITDELYLGGTGLINQVSVAKVGQLTGAQYLVYGSITNLSTKEGTFQYEHGQYGSISNDQHIVNANIAVRIMEVQSGRIVMAARGEGASTSTNTRIYYDAQKEIVYRDEDENGNIVDTGLSEIKGTTHTITIGTTKVSQVQVNNALEKAVENAVYGRYGILNKLDGKGKKRRR